MSLAEAALRARARIRRIADTFYKVHVDPVAQEARRRSGPPPPVPRGSRGVPHVVEDGGSRLEPFEAYGVYEVKAWAAAYAPSGGGYRQVAERLDAAVGVLVPYKAPESRVSMFRETLEAYVTLAVLRRASQTLPGGLLLWDGSFASLITAERPGSGALPLSRAEIDVVKVLSDLGPVRSVHDVEETFRRLVEERLESPGEPLAAHRLLEEARVGLAGEEWALAAFFEWLEKTLVFRMLLEEAWRARVTPVFVSKTSTSTILLERQLPDVYYLRKAWREEPFITVPLVTRGYREMKWRRRASQYKGPYYLGDLEDFYNSVCVVTFYVRSVRGGPILKVEAIYGPPMDPHGVCGGAPTGEAAGAARDEVYSALHALPDAGGYPYPLSVAHQRARITREEAEAVVAALGLSLERRSRHMLEG